MSQTQLQTENPLKNIQKLCIAACVYAAESKEGLGYAEVKGLMDICSKSADKNEFKILAWHHPSEQPTLEKLEAIEESKIFDEARRQALTHQIMLKPLTVINQDSLDLITDIRDFSLVFNIDELRIQFWDGKAKEWVSC